MTAVANGGFLATWPLAVLVASAAVAGLPALAAIGFAQWLVLRRFVRPAVRWIRANALAWAVALVAFTVVTTPLWQPGQAVPLIVLIGVLGGLLMAATMAWITGIALARLLRTRSPAERAPRR